MHGHIDARVTDRGFTVGESAHVPAGGTILACDVAAAPIDRSDCDDVAENLDFPRAITFDKWGDLWLLENDFFGGVARVSHTALP